MKKIIVVMTAALLVCLVLAGCTPKDAKPTENGTTPTLSPEGYPSPEGTVAPDGLSSDDGSAEAAASELEAALASEEGGLEVEEDYTVELGENVGVGGN